MPTVIAILNSKGGTGKTTLATNIGGCLHKWGYNVLIVDSDPQGTARDWHEAQPEDIDLPAVIGIDRPTLGRDIQRVAKPFDFVLIDGAAKLEKMSTSALRAADFVLIPVQPSGYDIWAVGDMADAIFARREVTDGKPLAAFVVSRQITGTILAREVSEALEAFELPILSARTSQRVVYAEAGQSGVTVLDLRPHGKAAGEIESITTEILRLLGYGESTTKISLASGSR